MNSNWKSKNRHKYLLQYHLIFVCKYRKKLLADKKMSDDIKQFSYEICRKHSVIIHKMKTDKDHIHDIIETEPNIKHKNYLSKHFGKEHTFWTDGSFICSIGNVSEKQLRKYIENQGYM